MTTPIFGAPDSVMWSGMRVGAIHERIVAPTVTETVFLSVARRSSDRGASQRIAPSDALMGGSRERMPASIMVG